MLTKEQIAEMTLLKEQGLTRRAIAKKYHVSEGTVGKYLGLFGLFSTKIASEKVAKAQELYDKGTPVLEIFAAVKISSKAFYTHVTRNRQKGATRQPFPDKKPTMVPPRQPRTEALSKGSGHPLDARGDRLCQSCDKNPTFSVFCSPCAVARSIRDIGPVPTKFKSLGRGNG